MTVEAATTITGASGFVLTSPSDNDPLQEGGSQLRLIKSVLATTFPNITTPVTATASAINAVASSFGSGVLTVPTSAVSGVGGGVLLSPSGTVASVSLTNVNGALVVALGGTTAMTVSSTGLAEAAFVNASSIMQQGAALVPRGIITMWAGAANAIPIGWALCDGTNGTPNLLDRFILAAGLSYTAGAIGGAASVVAATTTNGAHAHTSQTASGGAATVGGVTDQQGAHSHGGTDGGHSLTIAELPPHQHQLPGGLPSNQYGLGLDSGITEGYVPGSGGEYFFTPGTSLVGSGVAHSHTIITDGIHGHNLSITPVPAHTHGISTDGNHAHTVTVATVPPFYALAFIMKT